MLPGLDHPMMEAQEVEPLCSTVQAHDLSLLGMQTQPKGSQCGLRQSLGLFGPVPCGADDDEVVAVTHERPPPASLRHPCLVEDMKGDVGQQGRDG